MRSRGCHGSWRIITAFFVILYGSVLFAYQGGDVSAGEALQPFTLPVPESEGDRRYLELKGEGSFALSDIPSKFVIIEFLSVL